MLKRIKNGFLRTDFHIFSKKYKTYLIIFLWRIEQRFVQPRVCPISSDHDEYWLIFVTYYFPFLWFFFSFELLVIGFHLLLKYSRQYLIVYGSWNKIIVLLNYSCHISIVLNLKAVWKNFRHFISFCVFQVLFSNITSNSKGIGRNVIQNMWIFMI